MTTQNFNENRKYGVEIEFTVHQSLIYDLPMIGRRLGINIQNESYNHTTKSHWKVITDASCGFELVSPPLKGKDGFNQIELACKALAEIGATVNMNCGLHVHHDLNGASVKQIVNIFALYTKMEKTFDSMHPMSRRNNRFCQSSADLARYTRQGLLTKLSTITKIEELDQLFRDRYAKVNFRSYLKYGTIEFRQHSGTTNAAKIINWVMMSQQVVERANRTVKMNYNESRDCVEGLRNSLGLIAALGASDEIVNMFHFMKDRIKQFANS